MGMTIDDTILCLKGIKQYGRDTFTEQSDWQNSLDTAIDTMRKYQKIQEIINNAKDSDGAVKYNWLYEQISGVMEDGTD